MSDQKGALGQLLSGDNSDAVLFASLHALAFALSTVVIKWLSTTFPAVEQVFARACVGIVILAPGVWRERAALFSAAWPLLLFRGIAGFIGVFCLFYTVGRLPLMIAMVLTLVTPVFVMLISAVVLKERVPVEKLFYSVFVLLSVFIIVYPFGSNAPAAVTRDFYGYARDISIGIFGSIATAAAFVSIRAALKRVSVKIVVFYFLASNAVLALAFGASAFVRPSTYDFIVLVVLGLLGVLSDMFKTRAYKKALAGIVSVLSLMSIAFASLFGLAFFGEGISAIQIIGVISLLCGVFFLSLPDRKASTAATRA